MHLSLIVRAIISCVISNVSNQPWWHFKVSLVWYNSILAGKVGDKNYDAVSRHGTVQKPGQTSNS